MKFVVVEIAGKQYLVQEGDIIETEKLPAQAGDKMTFPQVLLFWNEKKLSLGQPYLEGFNVAGSIIEETKGPKVIAYKFKRRKTYRRKVGHRQITFKVKVDKIVGPSKAKKAAPKKEAALEKKKPKEKTAVLTGKKKTEKKKLSGSGN